MSLNNKPADFQRVYMNVHPTRPNRNEILENRRDFAWIWDLYGHLLKET